MTCRPGNGSVLDDEKTDPCSRRRYRQTSPKGRSPPPRGVSPVGLRPPYDTPRGGLLIQIVAPFSPSLSRYTLFHTVAAEISHRGIDEKAEKTLGYQNTFIDQVLEAIASRSTPMDLRRYAKALRWSLYQVPGDRWEDLITSAEERSKTTTN